MNRRASTVDRQPGAPLLIRLWLGLTALAPGLLNVLARRSHARMGADPARLGERSGRATRERPAGRLVWIHAASVGEVVSVTALARAVTAQTGASLLVTTATATGAATVAQRLPEALHQFLPVDTPRAVASFLTHWRPDAALFVEGDLWPRLIRELAGHGTPMALINARASRSRTRAPRSSGALLAPMHLVTVQEEALRGGLIALGLDPARIHAPGNLKADIPPPPVDDATRDRIIAAATGRAVWAAVSTHPGEEAIVLDAHAQLAGDPLLLLAPRHPDRGDELAGELARRGLHVTRHSTGALPGTTTQVHLVDTLGETGTIYAATGLALVGGSLLAGPGGHTPYEPASLGCAVLTGPHVRNFQAAFTALQAAGAAREVRDAADLARVLTGLLADPGALHAMQQAAQAEQQRQGGATARTLTLLAPILPSVPAP
ncbi:MAG: 3-deoxy-D-manno-octulosonic acid transferase [Pararhodobacter sp.]